MNPSVVVVGSFVQDLTWRCANFPRPGETVVGVFAAGPGGKGSNQAVACGRTGVPTTFIGAVGRDAFAAEAKRFYRENSISARFIEKPRHATGTAGILVNADGQNEIVVALGANAELNRRDLDERLLRRAAVVVTQLESNLGAAAHALRVARAAGVTTVLNPAPMRPDFDPRILKDTDILIPNETEFVTLLAAVGGSATPLTEADLAELDGEGLHVLCRLLPVPTVIVTLGKRGALVSQISGWTLLPGHSVPVVDTTGAGDAFVGGFAAGLVRFRGDILAAAELGNRVAALSVTKPGTAPSMPTAAEIRRFEKQLAESSRPRTKIQKKA